MHSNSDDSADFSFSGFMDTEHLFKSYYARLCYFANRIIENREASEDIVQDVFVKYWNKREGFNNEAMAKTYLYMSVRNACLNVLRHGEVQRKYTESLGVNELEMEKGLEHLIRAEVLGEIHKAITELPQGCGEVLKLAYFESLKNEEIASQLGISINTVKTQKQRALQLLRLKLDIGNFMLVFLMIRA